jgi:peptide/nickel transport system permease protein
MRKPTSSISSPFFSFLAKKVAFYIATYFVALSIIFAVVRLMPGNPILQLVARLVGGRARGPVFGVDKLYLMFLQEFGLDRPMHEQFLVYMQNMFTFNFGISITYYPWTVADVIRGALPWSFILLLPSMLVGFIVGNRLGAIAAHKKGATDNIVFNMSLFLSNMPYYCLALILLYIFAFIWPVFPIGGGYSFGTAGFSLTPEWIVGYLLHYTLPFLSLTVINIGGQAIGMRLMMIYELNSDYYFYSKQLGLSERKLVDYAYRNAVLPQITGLALAFGSIFGGALVTEIVFSYPGIGLTLYNAILREDYPLIQGCFAMITLTTLVANFVMDLFYLVIDPRIRATYAGEKT